MDGRDKGLLMFRGRPLAAWSVNALSAVSGQGMIVANRHLDRYASFGVPVYSDTFGEFDGPLAGVMTAMTFATTPYLLTIPCDTPLIDGRILERFVEAGAGCCTRPRVVHDGERLQPLFMLSPTGLLPHLQEFLSSGGRKVEAWLAAVGFDAVDLSDCRNQLVNLNTVEAFASLGEHAPVLEPD